MTTPPRPDPRVRAALRKGAQQWFHLGAVRNEVVGEQQQGEGQAATRSSADVYLFEAIGGWIGMTADDFVRDVAVLDVDHIDLHLNSPGGDAFEGVAIANVLRAHRADVTVWVDGIAASAASVVAMAGDEVVMNVGSQMMIHDASIMAWGDAAAMQRVLNRLNSSSDALAATYAEKAGGTPADWRQVMVAETWYTAEEAVAAGLADRVATAEDRGKASGEQIVPGQSDTGGYWDMWDRLGNADRHADTLAALYKHAGRADAPPPPLPGHEPGAPKTPAASAGGSHPTQEGSSAVAFSDEQLTTMRQELGLAADADEATITAALTEALAERATEPAAATEPVIPAGTVLVDQKIWTAAQDQIKEGVAARTQQRAERRERLVAAAIKDGRIVPADKASWLNDLEADPERREAVLARLTPGLVPVAETGHAEDNADGAVISDTDLDDLAAAIGLPKGALR